MSTSAWPTAVIDPHIHQWNPYSTPRQISTMARLLSPVPRIPRAIRWVVPQPDREFIGDPHVALKPYLPADYLADAGAMPVRSVVHIEAAWVARDHSGYVDETRWVSSLPFGQDGAPSLGGIIVNADPRRADIGDVLDQHLAASALVRGMRCKGSNHPDAGVKDFAAVPHVLSSPDFLHGFEAVAERDLSFEIWAYSHQLADAVVLAREYPQTTFVLDHYATPVGLFGPRGKHTGQSDQARAEIFARWYDDVAELAACPNVLAKHSGLGMPQLGAEPGSQFTDADFERAADRAAPLIRRLHEVFGADRTMWASNYPMDKPTHAIPFSARVLTTVLGADADPQKLFHDVAAQAYRIPSAH